MTFILEIILPSSRKEITSSLLFTRAITADWTPAVPQEIVLFLEVFQSERYELEELDVDVHTHTDILLQSVTYVNRLFT